MGVEDAHVADSTSLVPVTPPENDHFDRQLPANCATDCFHGRSVRVLMYLDLSSSTVAHPAVPPQARPIQSTSHARRRVERALEANAPSIETSQVIERASLQIHNFLLLDRTLLHKAHQLVVLNRLRNPDSRVIP